MFIAKVRDLYTTGVDVCTGRFMYSKKEIVMFTKTLVVGAFACFLTLPAIASADASNSNAVPHESEECHQPGGFYNPNAGWNNGGYYNGGCTYNDADFNNGWGWNPYTGTSCPPLQGGCDYTDADFNNGWGWDAATGTSCPPL